MRWRFWSVIAAGANVLVWGWFWVRDLKSFPLAAAVGCWITALLIQLDTYRKLKNKMSGNRPYVN